MIIGMESSSSIKRFGATWIGYDVSFKRHFYKPQPLRTHEGICADLLAIKKDAKGLMKVGAK